MKLDVKELIAKMLPAINGTMEVKEGVTVFRQGKLRIIRLDTPSNWCSTLAQGDRPSIPVQVPGWVYNGSTYVTCVVGVGSNGRVEVYDNWGNYISGAQWGFLRPRWVSYFVD